MSSNKMFEFNIINMIQMYLNPEYECTLFMIFACGADVLFEFNKHNKNTNCRVTCALVTTTMNGGHMRPGYGNACCVYTSIFIMFKFQIENVFDKSEKEKCASHKVGR